MNENTDEEVILNTQEEVDSNPTETDESSEGESAEDLKARLAKAEELANNYKIRAEKAEKKAKEVPEQRQSNRKEAELSTMDIIALSKANIETEDMAEVLEYAKFKGVSISEALKSPTVKAILQEKSEMRTTAIASNTGGAKRSSGKVSDETLLARASSGNIPESDEDIERLVRLKMQPKR